MDTKKTAPEQSSIDGVDTLALVCDLPADGRQLRRVDVFTLIQTSTSVTELPDGVELSFPNTDTAAKLAFELVQAERRCCAKFDYAISFEAEHAPIKLRITASDAFVQPLKELYLGLAKQAAIPTQTSTED
jgi:hypothetical protein